MKSPKPASRSARELEAFLHEKIPLTQAMEIRVPENSALRVVVEAPLTANINHLGTAFGGSLHALPTLAGYGLVWTLLQEAGLCEGHVVLKSSRASYREPVRGRLRAVCVRPPAAVVAEFLANVRRHKKARMELAAIVEGEGDQPAVEFHGMFVAVG
ncbi:MAG: YiiD C-terminal domain-containing protein [Opitutaceae bacterium]|nr:YiiD C-terminal domain-containing protein [Opitutaceae bacterium]